MSQKSEISYLLFVICYLLSVIENLKYEMYLVS